MEAAATAIAAPSTVAEPPSASSAAYLATIKERYRGLLEECRRRLTAASVAVPGGSALTAYLARGKMFRALLAFVAADTVGEAAEALPAAEAIELLHAASLIHDDIVDDASERRGGLPLHLDVGVPTALVVGDALILRSVAILADAAQTHDASMLASLRQFVDAGIACCRGELEELASDHSARLTEAEYFAIAAGKTAAQIATAAALGARLAGAERREEEALRRYGVAIGTAFQIRDDLHDMSEGSVDWRTFPFVVLRRLAPDFRPPPNDPAAARSAFQRFGVPAYVERVQRRFFEDACEALSTLPTTARTDDLRALATFATEGMFFDEEGGSTDRARATRSIPRHEMEG